MRWMAMVFGLGALLVVVTCRETEPPTAPVEEPISARSPDGLPAATDVVVTLRPTVAASRPGARTQFRATVSGTTGIVSYRASCGRITTAGVYTAPQATSGTCRVIASAGGAADTTVVELLSMLEGRPLGSFGIWKTPTTTPAMGVAPFRISHDLVFAPELPGQIAAARQQGIRLVLALTGGDHNRYKTDGVFDRRKWNAAMDRFDTPAIRAAVAQAVADQVILGASVMDEPQQFGTDAKAWGPPGTMTKTRVDSLCSYVKQIFPTLTVGVFHDGLMFEPSKSYRVCEFFMGHYAHRKGPVGDWRDRNLQIARRDDMQAILSLNFLNGGVQDKSGAWDCVGTGGLGTRKPNCRMTAQQLSDWGTALVPYTCTLFTWRYDAAFLTNPDNASALSALAIQLAELHRISCGRT